MRDSLAAVVHHRERQQAALTIQRETYEAEVTRLRDSVIALERRRAAAQLSVRQIRTVGALQDQLRAAFPELGESAWGLTTLAIDGGDTLGLEYLLVPAWFSETFVIDHANAQSWRAQKDRLLAVDSLRLAVTALQDSITRLVAANADAYRAGYQAAYAGYQDLSKRHIAELKKPQIRLGSALGAPGRGGRRRGGREGVPVRPSLRRSGLTPWSKPFSGYRASICSGPMSVDITLRQLETGRCELTPARCKLTSPRCESTSSRRQLPSPAATGSGSAQLTSPRCPLTSPRCRLASPRRQLTSSRCQLQRLAGIHITPMSTGIGPLQRSPQRLPTVLRPADLAPARGRPPHRGGNRQMVFTLFPLTRRFAMSQFPRTENDIAALALVVIRGLEQATDDFPNPPVWPAELRAIALVLLQELGHRPAPYRGGDCHST